MKNKLSKILNCFLLISIMFGYCYCYAVDNVENIFGRSNESSGIVEARDVTTKFISNFIAVFQVIGVGIAVFMLISLGMKYMAASVEDRAKIKEHAVVYVVGAVVFLGAAGILQIIQIFIKGNFIVN